MHGGEHHEVIEPDGRAANSDNENASEVADDGWEAVAPVLTDTSPPGPSSKMEDTEMSTADDLDTKPAPAEPSASESKRLVPDSPSSTHSSAVHSSEALRKVYEDAANTEFRQGTDVIWNVPKANVQSDTEALLNGILQAVLLGIFHDLVGEGATTRNVEELEFDEITKRLNANTFQEILMTYYNQTNGGFLYYQVSPDSESEVAGDTNISSDGNQLSRGSPTTIIAEPSSAEMLEEWKTSKAMRHAIDVAKKECIKKLPQENCHGTQHVKQEEHTNREGGGSIAHDQTHQKEAYATPSSLDQDSTIVALPETNSYERPDLQRNITPDTSPKINPGLQPLTRLRPPQTPSATTVTQPNVGSNGDLIHDHPQWLCPEHQSQSMNSSSSLVASLSTASSKGAPNNPVTGTSASKNAKPSPVELESDKLERQLNWLLECHDNLLELMSSASRQQNSTTVKFTVDAAMNALKEYGMTIRAVYPMADDIDGLPTYIPNKRRRHGLTTFEGRDQRKSTNGRHPVDTRGYTGQMLSGSIVAHPLARATRPGMDEDQHVAQCASRPIETMEGGKAQRDSKSSEQAALSKIFKVGTEVASRKDLLEQTETSIRKLSIDDIVKQGSHARKSPRDEARTNAVTASQFDNKSHWIDECEVNDYDTVINHTRRRSKPGQQAWMEARGRRRVIREEDAIELRKQFESTPILSEDKSQSYYPRIFYRIKDTDTNQYLYRNATLDEIRHNVSAKRATPKGNKAGANNAGSNNASNQSLHKKRKVDIRPAAVSIIGSNSQLRGVTLRRIISGYYGLLYDLEKRSGAMLSVHAQTFRKNLDAYMTLSYVDHPPETLDGFTLQNYSNTVDGMRRLWDELLNTISLGAQTGSQGIPSAAPNIVNSQAGSACHGVVGGGAYNYRQESLPTEPSEEADIVKIAAESLSRLGGSDK